MVNFQASHTRKTVVVLSCLLYSTPFRVLQKYRSTLKRKNISHLEHFILVWLFFSFVCHYWQWPFLINCVMCYYLCVLRWLMSPILALNCLLQIEHERSEEESSVGDALALAFRCARFYSASLILFASYSPVPLFMRPRHFVRSCAICYGYICLVCWNL